MAWLACLAFLCSLLQLFAEETAVVAGGRVNVRGQPSLVGEVITQLQKGEKVVVLEEVPALRPKTNEPLKWARIQMPANTPVWVYAPFIDPATKTVKVSRLNLRGGPGENYSVVGRLERGATVSEIRRVEDWMEIETPPGAWAFVAADLLTKAGAAPSVAVAHKEPSKPAPTPVPPPELPKPQPAPEPEPVTPPVVAAPTTAPVMPPAVATAPPTATTPATAPTTAGTPAASPKAPETVSVPLPAPPPAPVPAPTATARQSQVAQAPVDSIWKPVVPSARPASPTFTPTPAPGPVAAPAPTLEPALPGPAPAVAPEVRPSGATVLKSKPEEALSRRVVRREGLVRSTVSIQAPTYYELLNPDNRKTINYLHTQGIGVNLKDYRGRRIVVTGEEAIDPRWPKTPVIEVETLELIP
jgi:hypothetical protein